jgi:hypothetical protein
MPNGFDKNWVRMCKVINDFHWLHGRWPTRFVTDEKGYRAEDESGATCEYKHDIPRVAEWLGVHTKPHDFKRIRPWWKFWI